MRTLGKFAVLAAVVSALSCQNPLLRPDPQTDIQLEIELDSMPNVYEPGARVLAYQTAYVEVTVFNDSTTPFFSKNFAVIEENNRYFVRGSLPGLPAGEEYTLVATAFDGSGTAWTSGSAGFSVGAGESQKIVLNLTPLSSVFDSSPPMIDSVKIVSLPSRRTIFYSIPLSADGYYTVDVFQYSGGARPQVSASIDSFLFKEYQSYYYSHRVFGGQGLAGQNITLAVGNANTGNFPSQFYILIRRDGDSPPDGKELRITLDNQSVFTVNEWAQVQLAFYPNGLLVPWNDAAYPPIFTRTLTTSGAVVLDPETLAAYGRNSWAVRIIHDLDASLRMWQQVLSNPQDISTWHSTARATPDILYTAWNQVSLSDPGSMATPGVLTFNPDALLLLGGAAATISWQQTAAAPAIGIDPSEPNNNSSATPELINYNSTNHQGYISGVKTLHVSGDVDWYRLSNPPFTDSYSLKVYMNQPNSPPLRVRVYAASNLAAPILEFPIDFAFPWTVVRTFGGTAGDDFCLQFEVIGGTIGQYSFQVLLADEEEEPTEWSGLPNPFPLSQQWRQTRVSAINPDYVSSYHPYHNSMRYVLETDRPIAGYSRTVPSFPVSVIWGSNAVQTGPGVDVNVHPAVWGEYTSANPWMDVSLSTNSEPGRLLNWRLRHWEDEADFDASANDTAATAWNILPDWIQRGYSHHVAGETDWYSLMVQNNHTYSLVIEPPTDAAVRDDGVRVQARVMDNAGTAPVFPASGYILPDAGGVTRLEWTETAAETRNLEVLPATVGTTGGYTLVVRSRPSDMAQKDMWRFNESIDNTGPNPSFTLSPTDATFVTGSNGEEASAVRFTGDGKAVATGGTTFLANGAANDELTLSLRIRVPHPGAGPDQSLGWIFSQEDASNNLHIGLEAKRIGDLLTLVICSGTGESVLVAGANFDVWHHVTLSLPAAPDGGMKASFNGTFTNPAGIAGAVTNTAGQVFRLGGRAGTGTTFQGDIDEFRVFRGIIWDAWDNVWLSKQTP